MPFHAEALMCHHETGKRNDLHAVAVFQASRQWIPLAKSFIYPFIGLNKNIHGIVY